MFKEFLKSQHCLENLNFWLDVEKYKQASGDARDSEAKRIYESYISIMSPTEVKIMRAFIRCSKNCLGSVARKVDSAIHRIVIFSTVVKMLQIKSYKTADIYITHN